jgi:sentrin-specific protease 7
MLLTNHRPLPYIHGKRRALVNFTDLERLDEDVFLNDSLIDFYLMYVTTQRICPICVDDSRYLFEQANIPADKVYFFNTMFYSTLTRNVTGDKGAINYAGVARWTAKEDLFNYDYIVVPINERSVHVSYSHL